MIAKAKISFDICLQLVKISRIEFPIKQFENHVAYAFVQCK